LRGRGRFSLERLAAKSHDAAWKPTDENEIIDVRTIAKTLRNDGKRRCGSLVRAPLLPQTLERVAR
jgi:hypothetical protein